MSKEVAAAILVQTLFTAEPAMKNLMTSHARAGDAKPEDVAKFIVPYYRAMLEELDGDGGEAREKKTAGA